jgi:hypothetical protein
MKNLFVDPRIQCVGNAGILDTPAHQDRQHRSGNGRVAEIDDTRKDRYTENGTCKNPSSWDEGWTQPPTGDDHDHALICQEMPAGVSTCPTKFAEWLLERHRAGPSAPLDEVVSYSVMKTTLRYHANPVNRSVARCDENAVEATDIDSATYDGVLETPSTRSWTYNVGSMRNEKRHACTMSIGLNARPGRSPSEI